MTTKQKEVLANRQGDVNIVIPEAKDVANLKLKKVPNHQRGIVLAFGEVTGHAHTLTTDNCELFDFESKEEMGELCKKYIPDYRWQDLPDGSVRLLEIKEAPKELTHEEHAKISLQPGRYIVNIQQQYSPGPVKLVMD